MSVMTVRADTSVYRFGTQSLRCETGTTGSNAVYQDNVGVVAGEPYVVSIYVKTNQPMTGGDIVVGFAPAGGFAALVESDAVTDTSASDDNGWVRLIATITVPASVSSVRFYARYTGSTAGLVFWIDGVKFERGSIASAWQENLVSGAAVHDPLGTVIDASAGGIFRLIGSDGGNRDTVDLAAGGLRLAGDTNLTAPSIGVLDVNGAPVAMASAIPASTAGPDADITIDAAGAAGTAGTFARSAHGHKVATTAGPGADITVDTAGAAGATGAVARAGHGHKVVSAAVIAAGITGAATTDTVLGLNATTRGLLMGDGVIAKPITPAGFEVFAFPFGVDWATANSANSALTTVSAGNAGAILVPVRVTAPMLLQQVWAYCTDTATARAAEWRLFYAPLTNTATLNEVAGANGTWSFTPAAASWRASAAASAPVLLAPGLYWLVIRNTSATSTFGVGLAAAGLTGTPTFTRVSGSSIAALGSTIATGTGFAANNTRAVQVVLHGRAFNESAAY